MKKSLEIFILFNIAEFMKTYKVSGKLQSGFESGVPLIEERKTDRPPDAGTATPGETPLTGKLARYACPLAPWVPHLALCCLHLNFFSISRHFLR